MARYKLSYFNLAGSRGEECRLALHLAKVDFEDERIDREAWLARKPNSPFGSLPVLEVEGKGTLAQSNAILRFVGTEHGLHPSDPWKAAQHDAIMAAVEELRGRMDPSMRATDEAEKKKRREDLATGYLPAWGTHIERHITGPFIDGEKIHVADLKLFMILRWFTSGTLDHIPATIFNHCPKLEGVLAAAKKHPDIERWYATKR